MRAAKPKGAAGLKAKRGAKAAAVTLRQAKAVALRVDGYGFRGIAQELKISVSQAARDVQAVLDETRQVAYESAERHRAISLERLDTAIRALMPKVKAGDARAQDTLVRLEDRRAKLLGLDAASRVEHSGPAGAPIAISSRSSLADKLNALAEKLAGGTAGAEPARDAGEVPERAD